jgi:hypothetical protein
MTWRRCHVLFKVEPVLGFAFGLTRRVSRVWWDVSTLTRRSSSRSIQIPKQHGEGLPRHILPIAVEPLIKRANRYTTV